MTTALNIPETELRELIGFGYRRKEIAAHFGVSEATIKKRNRLYGLRMHAKTPFPTCYVCKVPLTEENTYKGLLEKSRYICRPCEIARIIDGHKRNPTAHAKRGEHYRDRHRGEIKGRQRKANQAIKRVVIAHYSGGISSCAFCGNQDMAVLTIDHINGNGVQDRAMRGSGGSFYRSLRKDGFPSGYQVLCMNCNWLKRGAKRRPIVLEVVRVYSQETLKCHWCRLRNVEALTIDHVNGQGRAHFRALGLGGGGANFYYWLRRNGYPLGYQVLCFNCQLVKRSIAEESRHG